MKKFHQFALLALTAVLLSSSATRLGAQEEKKKSDRPTRGNFDPEQMRQRMLESMRERFDVKDDGEWKILSERIEKVFTAQRETRGGSGFSFGSTRPPGGDRPSGAEGESSRRTSSRGGVGGEPNPDAEALQKAIEAKASADEIKAKLTKFREARKDKEAKLEKAQDELRQVLTVRQEATAVLIGLLK